MLIGELADATGTTTKTLRFYERQGLLPEPARTAGRYRDFPGEAVDRVRFVKDAQAAGFTLAEIGEILSIRDNGHPPCDHVIALVDRRLAEIDQRMRDLLAVQRRLRVIAGRAQRFDPADCDAYCGLITAPTGLTADGVRDG